MATYSFTTTCFTAATNSKTLNIFKPVFYKDELCFWTCTKGHEQDLGGSTLSGYNPEGQRSLGRNDSDSTIKNLG